MDDLISRTAAIDALENEDRVDSLSIMSFVEGMERQKAVKIIERLPSAQPEIIRCKDCVEWDSDSEWCNRHGGTMQENDFCSKAERRTDETDYRKE